MNDVLHRFKKLKLHKIVYSLGYFLRLIYTFCKAKQKIGVFLPKVAVLLQTKGQQQPSIGLHPEDSVEPDAEFLQG